MAKLLQPDVVTPESLSDAQDDAKGVGKPLAEQSQVQKHASQESEPVRPLPPSTPVRKAPRKGRHTDIYELNRPGTLDDQDDEGYGTLPNGKGKAEKWTPSNAGEGNASPSTSDVDSVFDDGSPRDAIDTPGTPYSTGPVSRTLHYGKQGYFNETPTRNRSKNRFAASEPKTKSDEDAVKVQLEDTPLTATKHIDAVEEDRNSNDDDVGSDEALPQQASHDDGHQKIKAKLRHGNTVADPKLQIVEAFSPNLAISKETKKLFRAKAIFYEALSKGYNKRDKWPGRLYIAIDMDDDSLKDHFKVGIVENENTVSNRYTRDGCKRKHSLRFVAVSDQPVQSVYRVEWLVHRELHEYRKKFNCKHCPKRHQEWIQADFPTVLDAVNRWSMFTSLVRATNGNGNELISKMMAFMKRRDDLQSVVEGFKLDLGDTTPEEKMTTFVDVTKTKDYTGAKDVKMMKEWEQGRRKTVVGTQNNGKARTSREKPKSNPPKATREASMTLRSGRVL